MAGGTRASLDSASPFARTAPLGELLSARIRSLIDEGELAEGARLPAESELASRFGVSRPIIREALSRLRSEGVIVSRRGSGSYVSARTEPPSAEPTPYGPMDSLARVRDCYQFRAAIEGDAAFYAASHRTPEALARIARALARMEAAVLDGAVGVSPDYAFHAAIALASGNAFFDTIMQQLQAPIEFTINLARSLSLTRTREHVMITQGEHVAIYAAIEAQDGEAARQAMRLHLDNTRQRIFEGPRPKAAP